MGPMLTDRERAGRVEHTEQAPRAIADAVQQRTLALVRAMLEGERSSSDLLGDALCELRAAVEQIRGLEAQLSGAPRSRDPVPAPLLGPAANGAGSANGRPALRASIADARLAEADGAEPLHGRLRARIAAALYLGSLRAGDRLPSIRRLARDTGVDHRAVAEVYRALEQDGLVEIRAASGVYVAPAEVPGPDRLDDAERWMAEILVGAVERGMSAADLPVLLERRTRGRALRCACVESVEDDRIALCRELTARFGLDTVPLEPEPRPLSDALRAADLVVTTPFHAAAVRRALPEHTPVIVARLHPALPYALQRHRDEHPGEPFAFVCVDSVAGARLLACMEPRLAERARVHDVEALLDAPDAAPPRGIATLAAWERLSAAGRTAEHLALLPHLAPQAVRAIAAQVVLLNRTAG